MIVEPGASAALVELLLAGREPTGHTVRTMLPFTTSSLVERPIVVDQTNVSVVVGERVVVKWLRAPGPDRCTPMLAHLAATGFARMPAPHAAVFRGDDLVVLVSEFLPAALDGWDWATDALVAWLDGGPPAEFGATLGRLAAELHAALATPSPLRPAPVSLTAPDPDSLATPDPDSLAARDPDSLAARDPVSSASPAGGPGSGHGWEQVLADAVASAGDGDEWVRSIAPRLAEAMASPARSRPGPAVLLHGDLHVGQVLKWRDGYAVTDFDGHPTAASRPEPVARDVARLRTSVLHVAEIANKRTGWIHGDRLRDWGAAAADDLLDAYRAELASRGFPGLFDPDLLRPFEVEQECRELVYAARFLPRWRYAPMGVLRSWFGDR